MVWNIKASGHKRELSKLSSMVFFTQSLSSVPYWDGEHIWLTCASDMW